MPTAEQFFGAANNVEGVAEMVGDAAQALTGLRAIVPITGCGLEGTVDQLYDGLAGSADNLAARIEALVAQLREREEVCRQYTELMREYNRAIGQYEGSDPPDPPPPPAPWAESSV